MLGRKARMPGNYLPLMENGSALWSIWWDKGAGTVAHEVVYEIFLNDTSARMRAADLARANPARRYAIKVKHA